MRIRIKSILVLHQKDLTALTNAVNTASRLDGLKKILETALELYASHRLIRQVLENVRKIPSPERVVPATHPNLESTLESAISFLPDDIKSALC